ncbi:Flp family type IVb pilin [Actinomadura flavalba]|uniref:Flp family type IVb pilin n=1 Tax=Actinomadura flavalba TaxID=1120938 RepID=UPI00036BC539|nr:hypothetical protein [Actinomadura flavalba]
MNPMIPLYVTLQTFVHGRVEAIKERQERGASAIEYAALILVAGVIIVALIAAAKDTVVPRVEAAIKKMFPE